MFSALTTRGASSTIEALSLGASDYVTKPEHTGSLDRSVASVQHELIPKIKQFFTFHNRPTREDDTRPFAPKAPDATNSLQLRPRTAAVAPQAVVIGVSTGGPSALAAILPQFPANFPVPVLIVQHMPPIFTKALATRLNMLTPLQVEEAVDGAVLEAGKIVIAPGDHHMQVRRRASSQLVATLNQDPHENSCRPSVDVLFRSAAATFGGSVVAVMLTGMGTDGVRGTAALSEKGAYIIAQDEASSTVWGMPGAVVRAGLANRVVTLSEVVPELIKAVRP
jgi:two-component system chemotaxis response regulator CheB